MRKITLLVYSLCCTLLPFTLQAQVNSENNSNCINCKTDTHASAAFEIRSNNQGILIPSMTTSEKEAIQNPAKGLLVFDSSISSFNFFNGFQWESLQGKTGLQGPIGVTGPTGIQGIQGIPGPKGSQGNVGLRGPRGVDGPQGVRGYQGPQGIRGIQGHRGPQGIQGYRGPQGPQGNKGVQGNRGVRGVRGVRGPRGEKGLRGHQGHRGLIGPRGQQGIQGPQGIRGPQGIQGPAGPCCSAFLEEELEEVGLLKTTFEEQQLSIEEQKDIIQNLEHQLTSLQVQVQKLLLAPSSTRTQNKTGQMADVPTSTLDTTHYSIAIKEEVLLKQNYPNPFNISTTIEYYVPPTAQNASLKFHTIDGKDLGTLLIENKGFGKVDVKLDQKSFLSGVILYTLYVDGKLFETKKMNTL